MENVYSHCLPTSISSTSEQAKTEVYLKKNHPLLFKSIESDSCLCDMDIHDIKVKRKFLSEETSITSEE